MNKIIPAVFALTAIVAPAAFAQQDADRFDEVTFGPRASVALNNFSSGYRNVDESMGVRNGGNLGAGFALNIPIEAWQAAGALSFSTELNFLYRKLYSYKDPGISDALPLDEYIVNASEFAVSVPAMLRLSARKIPIHIAAGVQADIPIVTDFLFDEGGRRVGLEFKERAPVDLGVVLGAGYNLTERFSFDLRWIKGLTKTTKRHGDKSYIDQYSVGISYMVSWPRQTVCDCAKEEAPASTPAPAPAAKGLSEEDNDKLEALSSDAIAVYKDTRGTILSMSDILFESGKVNLKEELKTNLTEIADILKGLVTESYIVIEGHSDNIGAAKYNKKLSEQRAEAVLLYLAERGIDKGKMRSVGHGLSRPVADNGTEEGRAKNRRVEIVITKGQP